jgi:hypothetical protein
MRSVVLYLLLCWMSLSSFIYCYAECKYAEGRALFIVMLTVITLSVIMLSVVVPPANIRLGWKGLSGTTS